MNVALPLSFIAISVAVAVAMLVLFFRETRLNPAFGFTAVLMYSWYSKWISCLYQSLVPVSNFEIAANTYFNRSSFDFLLYNLVMIAGIVIATRSLQLWIYPGPVRKYQIRPPTAESKKHGLYIIFGVLAVEVFNMIISGAVAIPGSKVDRINYWTTYSKLPINVIFGELFIFIPVMASALYLSATRTGDALLKKQMTYAIICYFVLLLLIGQRFHGIIVPGSLLLGVALYTRSSAGKPALSPKLAMQAGGALAVLLIYGVFVMANRGLGAQMGGQAALVYRVLVLQGGPIWKAHEVAARGGIGDFKSLFTGVDLAMTALGNPTFVKGYLSAGINFALALPSTLILVLSPFMTSVFCFIYGLMYGLAIFLMWRNIKEGRMISLAIASYVFLWTHGLYATGSLKGVLDIKLYLGHAALLVIELTRSRFVVARRPSLDGHGRFPRNV